MKVELGVTRCVVTREPGDRKFKKRGPSSWGGQESTFLHHVKQKLQEQGHDVIKKRMWKDGHMVDNSQQYIRERKGKFAVWWDQYALRSAVDDYNEDGAVSLAVVRDLTEMGVEVGR